MPEAPNSEPFTDEDVDELILLTQVNRYAGTFLLSLYDIDRVSIEMLSELTGLPESYKSMVLDKVRDQKAARQEDIGGGMFKWQLTPLGVAAVEKRLETDPIYALLGI